MTRNACTLLGLFILIGATTGCNSGLSVQSVTGKVTYKGEPVAGASVVFIIGDGSTGNPASTVTEADGTYSLKTHGAAKEGAMLGTYNVTIVKAMMVDRNGKEYLDYSQPLGPSGYPTEKHLLPMKYSGRKGPPLLTATVQKGKNVFNFDLED